MNKIYKVVWSKARQCYVVASELAHRSGKKSAAVLAVAACTMSIWGGQTALAAGTVSGGVSNTASGGDSSVSGGVYNTASGDRSSTFGGQYSVVNGEYSTGIAGGSTGADALNGLAAGYQSVVTVANGTAVGYQATTNEQGTIAFGHDSGDVSGYTVTWQKDSNGNNTKDITENKYTSAYYNRLVKVADGQSAHDVATVGQTATLGSTNGSVKITKSTNTNGSTNYDLSIDKITVNADGVIASGNTGILTGGTAYNYLKNANFYDSDARDVMTFKGSKGTRLTNLKDATLSAASTDAVTGRQLYATNQNIAGFAADIKSNTNTISDLAKSVTSTLDSVSSMSESFSSINSLKADASLNNLSDAGKQVISDAAKEAVQDYVKGLNSTSAAKSNILMKSNVAASPTLTSRMALSTSLLAVPADMSNSDQSDAATKDLDNLTDTGKQAIRNVMQSDLDQKADKTAVDEALSKKADKAEMDAALAKKADQSVVDEALSKKADKATVDEALTKKADADASNIDVAAFTKKLGTGSVAEGSANLVTGDTGFKAIQKTDAGLVKSDGKVMTLGRSDTAAVIDVSGANGARAITGVATDPMDATSAANVGYVNASAQGLHNEIQGVQQSLTDDIKKVGAGAAALAGLHPQDYDPEDKWDFAVGYGNYRGQNASAVAAYYHPNEDTLINVGSTLGNGNNMVTAGVSFKFGPGGDTHTMSRTALTQQVSTLREQNQRMGQGMNLLASENDALRKENQSLRSDMDAMKAQMQKMAERLEKLEQ